MNNGFALLRISSFTEMPNNAMIEIDVSQSHLSENLKTINAFKGILPRYNNSFRKGILMSYMQFLFYLCYLWTNLINCFSVFIALLSHVNPFQVKAPFLVPLKTSENLRFSNVFRGIKKEKFAWNGLILSAPTPQNGQTHLNNSSPKANQLFQCVWPFCGVGT